jgi:hypothetical protein
VDRFPRREERQRREEAGQDDQQQADAVHADVVLDAERGNPGQLLLELVRRDGRVEAPPEDQRRRERQERGRERDIPDERLALVVVAAAARQKHDEGADEWQKDDG